MSASDSGGRLIAVGVVPEHYLRESETLFYIYHSLVVGAAEAQADVALCLDEGSVNEHVYLFEQLSLCGHVEQLLVEEACVAPDVFLCLSVYSFSQLSEPFGLEHGVSS